MLDGNVPCRRCLPCPMFQLPFMQCFSLRLQLSCLYTTSREDYQPAKIDLTYEPANSSWWYSVTATQRQDPRLVKAHKLTLTAQNAPQLSLQIHPAEGRTKGSSAAARAGEIVASDLTALGACQLEAGMSYVLETQPSHRLTSCS